MLKKLNCLLSGHDLADGCTCVRCGAAKHVWRPGGEVCECARSSCDATIPHDVREEFTERTDETPSGEGKYGMSLYPGLRHMRCDCCGATWTEECSVY